MPKLYLIPTTLDQQITRSAILSEQLAQIKHIGHFIIETPKIGRLHIKQLNLTIPLQQLNVQSLNKHDHNYDELMLPLHQGHDLGLLTDCGCPAIADPGSQIVKLAHKFNYPVVPLVGPSSILLALMASGLNGQQFSFLGYLPSSLAQLTDRLQQLSQLIITHGVTQIFIEAPFRNQNLFMALINYLDTKLQLCLAINLMSPQQQIISQSISQWRQTSVNLNKQEVLFLLGST